MKKKYVIISTSLIVLIIFSIISVFLIIRQNNMNFAKSVINSFGGEMLLKKKCFELHQKTGLMTFQEILKDEKLCDCAVAQSYKIVINSKEHFKQINVHKMPADIIEQMYILLLSQYETCEFEMLGGMDKKYKTITGNK